MASPESESLSDWVDQLLSNVFFQKDDGLAIQSYENSFDQNIIVRVNHRQYNYNQYKESALAAREKFNMSIQSNVELLSWNSEEGNGGSVAQKSEFTLTDKVTGVEIKDKSVIIATVKLIDGKRVLSELTEVYA